MSARSGHRLRAVRRYVLDRAIATLGERRRRLLAWRVLPATGVALVTCVRDGVTWTIPAGDPHVGFGLFVEGSFSGALITALLSWLEAHGRHLDARSVFVDVGANLGSTAIPVMRATGCRAIAIEPVPALLDLLRRNLRDNGLDTSCLVVPAAVWHEADGVRLVPGDNIGAASVVSPSRTGAITGAVEAQGRPLDAILASAGIPPAQVAVVWSDVQGCERHVIDTGATLWACGVPLWAEFEPGLLAEQGGVDAFVASASTHFATFITADDLLTGTRTTEPRDIRQLPAVAATMTTQSDMLFLPPAFFAGEQRSAVDGQ